MYQILGAEMPEDREELDAIQSDIEHAYERLAERKIQDALWKELHDPDGTLEAILATEQANLDAHPESYRPGYDAGPIIFDKVKLWPGFYGKEPNRLMAKQYEVWEDHPLQCASGLLAAAGADQYIGPSQFMSMPSVTNLVARQAIVLCPIDEFGAFLARINSKRASGFEGQISGELRKLWSTSIGVYKTPEWAGRASETVYNPAMSILAASTPDEFYASLRAEDLTNGFLNRFLILTCNERPARGNPPKFKVPEEMAIRLRQLCEWRYDPVNVDTQASNPDADVEHDVAGWGSKSAEDTWLAFEEEMETAIEKDQRKQGFYQRCAEIAIRLATIRAAGRRPTNHGLKVGLSDVEWGIAVARTAADHAFAEAGDRMPEDLLSHGAAVTKVIDIIRKAGRKGISKSALLRTVQKSIKGKDLTAILQTLYDSKTIDVDEVEQDRGGRVTQIFKMA
jgi:hypothetical protein